MARVAYEKNCRGEILLKYFSREKRNGIMIRVHDILLLDNCVYP